MIDQLKRHAGSITVLVAVVLLLYWGSRRIPQVPNWLE